MSLIKYMGSADVKRMDPKEDFGGRLATPLATRVEWNWTNKHIVDTTGDAYQDISPEFWELLLEEPDMLDVTDAEVVPLNQAQRLWQGLREPGDPEPPGFEDRAQAVVIAPVHPAPPQDQ